MGIYLHKNNFIYWYFMLWILIQWQRISCRVTRGEPSDNTEWKYFKMPGVTPSKKDDYICTGLALNTSVEEWVLRYDPLTSAERAHHMLLYGCSDINKKNLESKYWDCGHHGVCLGGRIMYAWAKNAPATHLPENVGFRIGGNTGIRYLTLQIHYAQPLPENIKDESGLRMMVTTKPQKYKAGIYLLAAGFVDIPPLTPKTHADINCRVGTTEPSNINVFGFRVHAHKLGTVITGYKYNPETEALVEFVKGNPQWPQAFYPLDNIVTLRPEDIVHARCTYNSSVRNRHTYIGMTSDDEMCNLYLMYYTDREKGNEYGVCGYESFNEITRQLPPSSDVPLPPNAELEEMTTGENVNKDKEIEYKIGSSTGNGTPFHSSFDAKKALAAYSSKSDDISSVYNKTIRMPGITPQENDAYVCMAVPLNQTFEEWVLRYYPLASANRAHHMLLFGCSDVSQDLLVKGYWDCGHHGVCEGGRIMYAWAKNAPATHLPDNVGFRTGGASGVKYIALQIHYAKAVPSGVKDHSGLTMEVTTKRQKYKAGIYLLASGYVDIPPHTEKTHADINCRVGDTEPEDISIFAYRVHAHKLGSVITGYKYNPEDFGITEIAKGNPHWPQAFYPMSQIVTVTPQEILHARCTFNSTNCVTHTYIGSTANDEMCNLYLMYYTDADKGSEYGGCGGESFQALTSSLPPSSDEPLPPNPELEEMTMGENTNKDKEVTYNSLFTERKPIEVEKKTHSRKDPHPSGFNDYTYPNYEDYEYQQLYRPGGSVRGWSAKQLPEYINVGRFREEGKYQLKPKPVEVYNDYASDGDGNTRKQYIGKSSPKVVPQHVTETLISSPRGGKQLAADKAFKLVENWGPSDYKLGQVTGVAVDSRGDVVVFHRAGRMWHGGTFTYDNVLVDQKTAIPEATLLHLQRESGQVMHEWGANFFYMPHGLAIDAADNIWLTDVGMHQVFQFPSGYGEGKPLLTLGTKFEPGTDDKHFCKPTAVAVMKNGEFFVADGYCNSRIIHFSPTGDIIKQFGESSSSLLGFTLGSTKEGSMSVPHALALVEDHQDICVADREKGRVQCFNTETGKFEKTIKFDAWGKRIFAVAYTPHLGGKLFTVNGPEFMSQSKLQVFEVRYSDGQPVNAFSPYNQGLSNPHDLTLSEDGKELYVVEIGPNKIWKFTFDSKQESSSTGKTGSPNLEVKTGQLQEAATNGATLLPNQWSSVGISSVILGLVAVPIVVLSTLALVMKCINKGSRKNYLENGKILSGLNGGKSRGGGLTLGSLLNKRHGFEQVATNDIDDDELDSAESDIEEFSLAATKV